jgi:hypothetical protein
MCCPLSTVSARLKLTADSRPTSAPASKHMTRSGPTVVPACARPHCHCGRGLGHGHEGRASVSPVSGRPGVWVQIRKADPLPATRPIRMPGREGGPSPIRTLLYVLGQRQRFAPAKGLTPKPQAGRSSTFSLRHRPPGIAPWSDARGSDLAVMQGAERGSETSYFASPTAARASASVPKFCTQVALPSRALIACHHTSAKGTPPSRP